jgi:hypothetical protein
MCRRSDAVAELSQAARCLTDACATRIATSDALQSLYAAVVAEPVPPQLGEMLARLGAGEGGDHGAS